MPSAELGRQILTGSVARSRARCEQSLARFAEEAWDIAVPGSPFVASWHLEEIAKHLEAVARRELLELVVCQPPGTTKSMMACVLFPAWVWTFRPAERFLLASYDDEIGIMHNERTIKILTSDWYQARWGKLLSNSPSAKKLRNERGGSIYTTSCPLGTATGMHADIKLIDDPVKAGDATSARGAIGAKNKAVSEWRKTTFSSRNTDHSRATTVLVMQRLADDDLAGELVKEGFTEFRLPMRFEAHDPCSTPYGRDRRTAEGELLCPDRIDSAAVAKSEKDLGDDASAQLQQRPIKKGGGVYNTEFLQYYDQLPAETKCWIEVWDTNFKGPQGTDPVVGYVMCIVRDRTCTPSRDNYYVIDAREGMFGFSEHCQQIRDLKKEYPKLQTGVIEESANGPAIKQVLDQERRTLGLDVELVKTKGGKHARANAASKIVADKRVFLPRDPKHAHWVGVLEEQLAKFGRMRRDDHADAFGHGVLYLHENSNNFQNAMARVRAEMSA